jgi:ankyrin repeat protein
VTEFNVHDMRRHYPTEHKVMQSVGILNFSLCTDHESLFSAVYFAAQEGHLVCIQWLVETAGADPQLASTDGMTPLHAAAQTGRLNVTYWLVRYAHCPISCRASDGATPVHFAVAKGQSISHTQIRLNFVPATRLNYH